MADRLTRRGSELSPDVQKECLAQYVHRYTGQHKPQWAGEQYKRQFKDDAEWLDNTFFHVTKAGRLDNRYNRCESTPTWN
jgi:hypothetical protein